MRAIAASILLLVPTLAAQRVGAAPPAQKPAVREVVVRDLEGLRRGLSEAEPGDHILLEPGTYSRVSAANVAGEAGREIVMSSKDPARPAVLEGGVHFSDVAHLTLAQLTIQKAPHNGLNIDDAGSFETPSHHIVLRGLVVIDNGASANEDGIKLSGVEDFRVVDCKVARWGRGGSALDMVGCKRGVIEACQFEDRAQDAASSGVQAKGGSRDIAIVGCRFVNAGQRAINLGGSTGLAYFRPRPEGFEAKDLRVEGCTFVGSQAPIAFVGVDGASVRWNTFVEPEKWCLRVLQETRDEGFAPCRNGLFADNWIVYRAAALSTAVNVGPGTAIETFRFERNHWQALGPGPSTSPRLPTADPAASVGDPGVDALEAANQGPRIVPADSPVVARGAHAWPDRPER